MDYTPRQFSRGQGILNIGAIARQSGIEAATLRKWEVRYGFPKPLRTVSGRREYSADTLVQLLSIRRRLESGERTGKILLDFPSRSSIGSAGQVAVSEHAEGISRLLGSDIPGLRQWLLELRKTLTALEFVERIAAPMAREVGCLWADGALPVFAEHLFSEELLSVLLHQSETPVDCLRPPRVLLTAPAGEKHCLGLRMAGAVLAEAGENALYLSSDLPNREIIAAAVHHQVCAVGLTTSLNYPPKLLFSTLQDIRQALPASVQLWVGGAGACRLPRLPDGTSQVASMPVLLELLKTLPATCNTAEREEKAP